MCSYIASSVLAKICDPKGTFAGWHSQHYGYEIPIVTEYLILRKSNILWRLHLKWDTCFMLEEEFASSKRHQEKLTLQD